MKKLKRVYLEISNICNLSCSFCIDHQRPYKKMSLEEIRHALVQIKPFCDYIYLHVQGEPLLHPELQKIFDLMDEFDMKVQLVTNGSFLKNHFWLLKRTSLRKISFSAHSLEFQKCDPEEWLSTVFSFMEQASRNGHPYCEIRFWNQNNLSETSKNAIEWISERTSLTETSRKGSWQMMPNCYLHYDNQFQWPEHSESSICEGTCHGAIDMIAILADGTVVPCCLDARGKIQLGNLFETPLEEILHSKRLTDMVQGFHDYKIKEELCKHCTYRLRFNRKGR